VSEEECVAFADPDTTLSDIVEDKDGGETEDCALLGIELRRL
jgi:hypothetical protein